jgi:VanZ family protein
MKIHLGYGLAAIGYMLGIFFLSNSPEDAGSGSPGTALFWNLVHIPLFAGLTSCLLLSLSDGQWFRRVPWRLYAVISAIAGAYAGFAEWHQSGVSGRYATSGDVVLNLVGVAALVVVHRLAGGQGPSS